MTFLLKAVFDLCAETFAATTRSSIFTDIVNPNVKKFSMLNNDKFEF